MNQERRSLARYPSFGALVNWQAHARVVVDGPATVLQVIMATGPKGYPPGQVVNTHAL